MRKLLGLLLALALALPVWGRKEPYYETFSITMSLPKQGRFLGCV